VQRFTAEG
jgi:hypothetical protein